jgi:hypothetical protein
MLQFMEHDVAASFTRMAANIDDPVNIITLRTDLSDLGIDRGHFVFVPIAGRLTVYFITTGLLDLAHEFHNRRIYLPKRISRYGLYCRFAWSVFKALLKFFPRTSAAVIRIPVPEQLLQLRKRSKAEPKGTIKGKGTAAVHGHGQSSGSDEMEIEDGVDNASLLSSSLQSDNDIEHPLDLSLSYTAPAEAITILAAEDARITKEVGPTLGRASSFFIDSRCSTFTDDSNVHLLSDYDAQRDLYPGFSKFLRLQQSYLHDNPQVRAVNKAAIGRINDGYESDTWGWTDEEGESEEEEPTTMDTHLCIEQTIGTNANARLFGAPPSKVENL